MEDDDPISHFFPDQESVDLYEVLSLDDSATPETIRKAYRRLALLYHPDKHATASESAKAEASLKFQQIGFSYAVLSDEKRKERYDTTGQTNEGFELGPGEDGWEAYFEAMFERVTRGKLDEMKKEYQGSQEEIDDVKRAYEETSGSIGEIMTHVPHSTHDDEARIIVLISQLIDKKELPRLDQWESSIKDEKAKLVRKKQGEKEAKEAEALAKELGVWDEFYGSGKATSTKKKKGKGKGQKEETADGDEDEDFSALQALILKKKQNAGGFLDALAAKYATEEQPKSKDKGKKRKKPTDDTDGMPDESPKKRKRGIPPPPDINDEEFEKLQQQMFSGKKTKTKPAESISSATSTTKGRKRK